jgi:hypothetical protein
MHQGYSDLFTEEAIELRTAMASLAGIPANTLNLNNRVYTKEAVEQLRKQYQEQLAGRARVHLDTHTGGDDGSP